MNLILKRDSDLQTVAEIRERIQSIRFQRESEINRGTRSHSVTAWERKKERIRQFTKYEITKTDSSDNKTVIASGLALLPMIDALQLHAGENGTFDSNTLSARDTQGNLFLAWPLN